MVLKGYLVLLCCLAKLTLRKTEAALIDLFMVSVAILVERQTRSKLHFTTIVSNLAI